MSDHGDRNILFVVLDTVRRDRLGAYGYDRPTTPAIDAFAETATVVEQAVAPAPWTLPVHASMFTGRYPSEHGADQQEPYLRTDRTLAGALAATGMHTACFSSNAWITPYTGMTQGFAEVDNFFEVLPGGVGGAPLRWVWEQLHQRPRLRTVAQQLVALGNRIHERTARADQGDSKTPAAVERAIATMRREDRWFVFLNLMDAHLPYHPPEPFRSRFAPGADPAAVCQNSKEYNAGVRAIDDAEWSALGDLYDAAIASMDDAVGRLLSAADAHSAVPPIVVIAADHGELLGEHELLGHEFAVYDPLVHVPLVIRHPALPQGRLGGTVELLDLYHTLLAGRGTDAGVDPTRCMSDPRYRRFDAVAADARDPGQHGDPATAYIEYARPVIELAQLERRAAAAGATVAADHRARASMRAARRPDAKLIDSSLAAPEGFDLRADPDEAAPLAADDPHLAEVRADLGAFAASVGPLDPTASPAADPLEPMDAAAQQRLRELGYL